MEKKESIFSSLNPAPPPARQPPAAQGPAPAPARAEKDPRVDGLEAAVKALQAEIAVLRQAAAKPPPPPPPAKVDSASGARLDRSEKAIAEMRAAFSDFQSRVEKRLETPASREEVEAVKFNIFDVLSDFELIKRRLDGYAGEFAGIEQECHKSLGEMQGYAKNISQKLLADRFDEHLKESVSRLSGKVADLEKAMHAGLTDLSGRLLADEALYKKIFTEAEDRLRKGLDPDLQSVTGQLKNLTSRVMWLTEEYTIVMERKMRALEVKYSAFDVLAARVDAVNEALRAQRSEKTPLGDGRPPRES